MPMTKFADPMPAFAVQTYILTIGSFNNCMEARAYIILVQINL